MYIDVKIESLYPASPPGAVTRILEPGDGQIARWRPACGHNTGHRGYGAGGRAALPQFLLLSYKWSVDSNIF